MPVEHIWGIRSTDGTDNNFHEEVEIYGEPILTNNIFTGGKIFGEVVITGSMIGGNTVVAGKVQILDSNIMGNSMVMENCWVWKSHLSDSVVVTDRASVKNSVLYGDARVFGEATVKNAILGPGVIIKGTAKVIGPEKGFIHFNKPMTLDRGEWSRPPISFTTSSGLIVTESIDDMVKVNCQTAPVSKWLGGAGDRYGKQLGMTDEERRETLDLVKIIGEMKGL